MTADELKVAGKLLTDLQWARDRLRRFQEGKPWKARLRFTSCVSQGSVNAFEHEPGKQQLMSELYENEMHRDIADLLKRLHELGVTAE